MKIEYTNDELNELLDASDHFLILAQGSTQLHFISSKPNWITDGQLLISALELVKKRISESQN
jgi:hypothetical protein